MNKGACSRYYENGMYGVPDFWYPELIIIETMCTAFENDSIPDNSFKKNDHTIGITGCLCR